MANWYCVSCRLAARSPSSALRSGVPPRQWPRDAAIFAFPRPRYSTTTSSQTATSAGVQEGDYGRTSSVEQHAPDEPGNGHGPTDQSAPSPVNTLRNEKDAAGTGDAGQQSSESWRGPMPPIRKVYIDSKVNQPVSTTGDENAHHTNRKSMPDENNVWDQMNAVLNAAVQSRQKTVQWEGRVISTMALEREIKIRDTLMFRDAVPGYWGYVWHQLRLAKSENIPFTLPWWLEPNDTTKELIQLLEKKGIEEFRQTWEQQPKWMKRSQWARLAFWWLDRDPQRVLEFVIATNISPYAPHRMVSDCLLYIHDFHPRLVNTRLFRKALKECLPIRRWPMTGMSPRAIRVYIQIADLNRVEFLFDYMRRWDIEITAATALCFMTRFTRSKAVDRAIEALRLLIELNDEIHHMNSESVIRHCCKLLTLDTVEEHNNERNFRILPRILELGVRPTRDMMNVVVSNAFRTGDVQLGLDMLKYMQSQGMEFDSYTYLTMLDDAVARGDRQRVDELLQEINPREDLVNNQFIASKIIHAQFTFTAKNISTTADPTTIFLDMLDLYSRYFDLTPLKELQLISPTYNAIGMERDLTPGSHVLFIMMATYLRCSTNPARVWRVHRRFEQLIEQRHPVIAPLVQFPHFNNEFIRAFRPYEDAVRHCVNIVNKMLKDSTQPFELDGKKIRPAAPDVWTWNVLLSVFVRHGKHDGVEAITEMMKRHNVSYDQATWNTILQSKVARQDVNDAAATIREMESRGYSTDQYTLRALRFLRNPEQLRQAVQDLESWEKDVEEKEREELLDRSMRRLAAASNSK
ncbi:hypothetical protein VTN49DRAFT_1217 [Thermomyces lanuginosus]|uniref:uncharacterized protein n=1 Tax=Thermomyces lanuginosus TaxID=5541 RepID=UPI003744562A